MLNWRVLYVKVIVGAFKQEKILIGAFSVIVKSSPIRWFVSSSTPRDSSADHCGCQHLVSRGGRVSCDKIPGQHVPTNVLEFLIFFGINRNTNEN